MIATVSPRPTPRAASPPATFLTWSAYSPQVSETSSSFVRSATSSATAPAVIWNASQTVLASMAGGRSVLRSAVLLSKGAPLSFPEKEPNAALPDLEALTGQATDVVRQPEREQPDDEHEADDAGFLHQGVGDGLAPDQLHEGPEDVPAVEGQEREQVHD